MLDCAYNDKDGVSGVFETGTGCVGGSVSQCIKENIWADEVCEEDVVGRFVVGRKEQGGERRVYERTVLGMARESWCDGG